MTFLQKKAITEIQRKRNITELL